MAGLGERNDRPIPAHLEAADSQEPSRAMRVAEHLQRRGEGGVLPQRLGDGSDIEPAAVPGERPGQDHGRAVRGQAGARGYPPLDEPALADLRTAREERREVAGELPVFGAVGAEEKLGDVVGDDDAGVPQAARVAGGIAGVAG